MRLKKLRMVNFRCFEDRELEFSPQFNLLIGENGVGKTAALEAVACVLGSWLKRFPNVRDRPLSIDDFRVTTSLKGTQLDEQRQRRVLLEASAVVDGANVEWAREKSWGGRTRRTPENLDQLAEPARAASDAVVAGADHLLPLICYYGTGRLWDVPRAQRPRLKTVRGESTRLKGYEMAVDPRARPELLIEWLTRQEWVAFQQGVPSPALDAVKSAITGCLDHCEDIRYDAAHQAIMISFKAGEYQNFARLSDGQRNVMAMVADIAIKAATLNPALGAYALHETPGVVLIDELDLHLHPLWQRRIIDDLKRVFPKIQFIATTHSPFLIQALEAGELINLQADVEEVQPEYADKSVEDIAENVMGVEMPQKSERYQQMMEVAEEYYTLLRQPDRDPARLAELERALDEKTMPFGDDPAFAALLKLDRLTQEGQR